MQLEPSGWREDCLAREDNLDEIIQVHIRNDLGGKIPG
jgi:hypothetical protein